jgi:3-hydroxyisobutyrate dehydrogenase
MTKIGFIGLGNMGLPMATNLVRAGHAVTGFDLIPQARAAAAAAGITIVDEAAQAARNMDTVVTMLPNGRLVRDVYAAILPEAAANTLFIDSSTIDVESARMAHTAAATAGMASLDAPVSGGVSGALAARLTFMAGGDEAAFRRAKPVLALMGQKIVHCGDAGAGQAAKICNNMILGISMIAVSEAFVLAENLGLSPQALFEVASTSSGQCWALTSYCPVPGPVPASPANHDFKPGFAAGLMLKDLLLSQDAAAAAGAQTALGKAAAAIYADFVRDHGPAFDFSAIINSIRKLSAV